MKRARGSFALPFARKQALQRRPQLNCPLVPGVSHPVIRCLFPSVGGTSISYQISLPRPALFDYLLQMVEATTGVASWTALASNLPKNISLQVHWKHKARHRFHDLKAYEGRSRVTRFDNAVGKWSPSTAMVTGRRSSSELLPRVREQDVTILFYVRRVGFETGMTCAGSQF
jgi:hypothetical protein